MRLNIRLLICLSFLCFFSSCNNCKRYTEIIAKENCTIVVEIPPTAYPQLFKVKGYDPANKKPIICESSNRWWDLYNNEIEIGDTLVKKKGELTFNIHKKDTVITHYWKCYEN